MYVHRLICIPLFLLLTMWASGQSATDSAGIYSKDTVVTPPVIEKFDIDGKKIDADTSVAFGADKIIPGKDSSSTLVKKHSPAKAVWMSAVLPGLGQGYNKKYWKIPIIYAGFGGLGYWIYFESHQYNLARTSYRAAVRDPSNTAYYLGQPLDAATIKTYRDYYKGFLNYASLATVLWYGLNLIDAAVDGHLYHFNVDDKLSFNFDPSFLLPVNLGVNQVCLGLTFKLIPLGGKKKPIPDFSLSPR